MERELLEQCDQVATLVECFAWLQRCDECIEQLEEFCHAKRPRLLDTDNPRWRGSRDSWIQNRNWNDVSYTLMVSNEYANGNERSLVWREVDTMFENGEVVNVDYIEPRRFLEDA